MKQEEIGKINLRFVKDYNVNYSDIEYPSFDGLANETNNHQELHNI